MTTAVARRRGASPEDWTHFDLVLGLTEDLLPLVCDPTIPISPHSKMASVGKTPSRINGNGHVSGFKDWTQKTASDADIGRWLKDDRLGICLQTRRVRALDIDVPEYDESVEIEEELDRLLSGYGVALPRRQRKDSMKFLLAFEMPGDYTKRSFKTKGGLVEFLATGQQFVAIGTHTDGARYEWVGGLPDSIPALTPEQFEAIWSVLEKKFAIEQTVEGRRGVAPLKPRTDGDADDPVIDYLYTFWTVYGTDRSGRVDIECPFQDGHSTNSGESSTSYFPAGVGGFERGHFRCLHTSCANRKNADFLAKIGWMDSGFDEVEVLDPEPRRKTALTAPKNRNLSPAQALPILAAYRDKELRIEATRHAVTTALQTPDITGFHLALDTFRDEILIEDITNPGLRPFRDADYHRLALALEERGGNQFKHIPQEILRSAVQYVACENEFDSAKHWLQSLKWDGVRRCAEFWPRYMHTEDTEYSRAVGLYMWSAMAGRAIEPGVKADMVPVATGGQGAQKSSAVAMLVTDSVFFGEIDLVKDDDALARDIRGKLVMEIGEFKGVSQRQIEHLKAWVVRREDKWVPKYKEYQTNYPRRCLFIVTTNEEESLPPDHSGHRRWLPLTVPDGVQADLVGIERDRDQLWAEALTLYLENGVMWQDAERLARPLHDQHVAEDPWMHRLQEWAFTDEMGDGPCPADSGAMHINEFAAGALGIAPRDVDMRIAKRIGECLKKLGFRKTVKSGRKAWAFDKVK